MSDTELDATVADALDRAARIKEQLVAACGVGEMLPLMIELRRDGVRLGSALPDGARHAVMKLIMMAIALSDADNALFLGEAFAYHAESRPDRRLPAGELAQWFADGEPNTHECIQVLSAHQDGRFHLGQHAFHYEGRQVVWDDIYVYGHEALGELTTMMRHGFRMQRNRPFAPLTINQIGEALQCEMLIPRLAAPKRNAPCPCGSGNKAKHCCWA